MRPSYLVLSAILAFILACGGGAEPTEVLEMAVELPDGPPPPQPPEVRSGPKPGTEVDEDVRRRLSGADGLIRRCLERHRGEIPRAHRPVEISLDLHAVRATGELTLEVTRSGFGAPDVVDRCVLDKLIGLDLDGLRFDVMWQVVADFP